MSVPISATNCSATRRPIPGTSSQIATASSHVSGTTSLAACPPEMTTPAASVSDAGAAGGIESGGQRGDVLEDLSVKLHDLLVQKVNMDQMLSDQEAMVVPHASGQGLFQRGAFTAHPALRQLCQCRSIAVTIHNRFEHCSS